jgi:hypothetical protein
VAAHDLPNIEAVLARSAIASTSVRTIGPTTDLGEGYATIGAGNRTAATVDVAGMAYEPSFSLEWGNAGEVFQRRSGEGLEGASVVHLGMTEVTRRAERMLYGSEPGALGEAVRDAGLRTAVVANADVPDQDGRQAALAVVDELGRIDAGSVGLDLLTFDPASPFGVALNPQVAGDAAVAAIADADVTLVEASDLARADAYRPLSTPAAREQALERALASTDELVGRVAAELDPERDLLMLVGPDAPSLVDPGDQEQLTVFALSGAGTEPGLARSGTTRRAGYVTLPDVAPTVLDHLGIEIPDAMAGTAITSAGGGAPTEDDIAALVDVNDVAKFRDRAVGPVSVVYIVLQVVVYGLAVLALLGARPKLGRVALAGCLVVLAIPPVVFLSGLVPYDSLSVGGYTLAVLAAAGVVAAAAWAATRRHLLGPPLVLIGLSWLVNLVDVATGGRLQINTVFGYSPVVAGRFAGFGNLSFALTAIAAVAVGTGVWAWPRLRGRDGEVVEGVNRRGWPLAAAAAVFAVTLVLDGLPTMGSDVGGVLAAGPGFAVALLLLAGAKVDIRRLLVIGLATVAVLGLFTALDLSRPADQRTHLSRFAESTLGGGAGTILGRKLQANVSILTSSVWTWLVPVGLAFLAFLTWRSRGLLQRLQERVPGLRAFLVGGLLVATLGLAVNDSGVAIPAMMFGVALPYIAYLVIRTGSTPPLGGGGALGALTGRGAPPAPGPGTGPSEGPDGPGGPGDTPAGDDVAAPSSAGVR